MWQSTWVDILRLEVIKQHTSSPNRITEDRAEKAIEFIDILPAAALLEPRMIVALDGEIALMWEVEDRCLVVVPEGGGVRYVAQFGKEERKGRVAFNFGVPSPVREILSQGFARRDA